MHKVIKLPLSVIFIFGFLSACQQSVTENQITKNQVTKEISTTEISEMNPEEAKIVSKMGWVLVSDPLIEAQRSFAPKSEGKPELIAFSNMALNFPGLTEEQYETIKDLTSYRIPAGTGDIIYGEEHGRLHAAMYIYAKEYNKAIFNALAAK